LLIHLLIDPGERSVHDHAKLPDVRSVGALHHHAIDVTDDRLIPRRGDHCECNRLHPIVLVMQDMLIPQRLKHIESGSRWMCRIGSENSVCI
jgi:hypothetical protein